MMSHLTVAVSESAFKKTFDLLVKSTKWSKKDSTNFGPLSAGYDVRGHLEGGSIDLHDDNTIGVSELDIKWDKFMLSLGLDIPSICIGGGCISIPDICIFGKCFRTPDICIPRFCIFDNNPDIEISLDISSVFAQEISFEGSIISNEYDASDPESTDIFDQINDWLREQLVNAGLIEPFPDHDQWHIHIDPETIDFDFFDFADIIGDLVQDTLNSTLSAVLPSSIPQELREAAVSDIADAVRDTLDILDDIEEWVNHSTGITTGLFDSIMMLFLTIFSKCVPLYRIDNPFELIPSIESDNLLLNGNSVTLVPVQIPIRDLSVRVTDDEMIIQADTGV